MLTIVMTQPYEIVHASKLFQEWLTALKEKAMLATHNQSQAMFRSVLHNLRRHMTTQQVLAFADALPPLPRGIFIEGWRPADPPSAGSANDLLREVVKDLAAHHVAPDSIVADVFAVLREHSDEQTAKTMKEQIPEPIRSLWPNN
jgi:uncharacterized protein (DUF2267 family)